MSSNVDCMGCVAAHFEGCPHPGRLIASGGTTHWALHARSLADDPIPICTLEWDATADAWWADRAGAWVTPDGRWRFVGG